MLSKCYTSRSVSYASIFVSLPLNQFNLVMKKKKNFIQAALSVDINIEIHKTVKQFTIQVAHGERGSFGLLTDPHFS